MTMSNGNHSMLDRAEIVRRTCPVFFLLDTSGSMTGAPIGAVNAAMEGILPELASMNEGTADAELAVGVLTFDSAVRWVTKKDDAPQLVDPNTYAWNDLSAFGATSMGAALGELKDKLSVSHGVMKSAAGSVAPVLFLLSDGAPTDEYHSALDALRKNPWFRVAVKVAIGYGDSNDAVLEEFTGNPETVLHTNDPNDLKRLIQFVTITATQVATSTKQGIDPDTDDQELEDKTKQVAEELIKNGDPDESWD